MSRWPRRWDATAVVGVILIGIPLCAALCGPLIVPEAEPTHQPLLPPGADGTLLGTDTLGRDVLGLALTGGGTLVGLTAGTLFVSYLVGMPIGLAIAATRRRWLDTTVLRIVDVALVLPPLLVLLVLAGTARRGVLWLVLGAAFTQVPAVVRLVRAAASGPHLRSAQESMIQCGEPWWRSHLAEPARGSVGPLAVDAGTRVALIVTVLTSANYLGVGLEPTSSDWGVVIQQNSSSLFVAPAPLLIPATLLIALCVGANLLADRALDRWREPR